MTLDRLNTLSPRDAVTLFRRCCGSLRWAQSMQERRPFTGVGQLHTVAKAVWNGMTPDEWREAFAQHPRIGDIKSLRKKFSTASDWAKGEQAEASGASERVLKSLYESNNLYEAKFGYIFIVSATGKSAEEMLAILNRRLNNAPSEEIKIAAQEHAKITRLRLEKLLASDTSS